MKGSNAKQVHVPYASLPTFGLVAGTGHNVSQETKKRYSSLGVIEPAGKIAIEGSSGIQRTPAVFAPNLTSSPDFVNGNLFEARVESDLDFRP